MQLTTAGLHRRLTEKNARFLPNLDFVRCVAVLLVVADHTLLAFNKQTVWGWNSAYLGMLGVWMFFVHTATVLMWSLERKPFTLDFYIRRIFRIYPLALAAIAVALITRAPLLGSVQHFFGYVRTTPGNLIATSLLAYNLFPAYLHYHQIVNVMWTLPLEVDMYLVLPFLFAFVTRERKLWPLLLLWGLAVATAKFYFTTELNLVSAAPDFLAGVMAYVGFKSFKARLPAWSFPIFLTLLVSVTMRHPRLTFAWPYTLVLGLALPHFLQFSPGWFALTCNRLARYSYGVYLTHPFALVLGVYCLPLRSPYVQLGVEFAVIAVGSVASYHLLEKPMIDVGSRLAAKFEQRAVRVGIDSPLEPTL